MPDVLAIVSKAIFEASSRNAAVGQVLDLDRYVSTNKALGPLKEGGRLFLVTVRPPDEKLWLVAVLDSPKHDGKAWVAKKNVRPVADLSHLRGSIRFTSNTGISSSKGALGMSLQTPRQLTPADVALMLGGKSAAPKPAVAAPAEPKQRAAAPPPHAAPPAKTAPSEGIQGLLEAAQWPKAMEELLSRWREDPAPELAELIERVSAKLPRPKGWKMSAADASKFDLAWLLTTLTDGKFAQSLERIRQLARLRPDPRVAAALTRFVVTPPFTAQSSRDFWTSLFEQLTEAHVDPRTHQALALLAKDYQATFGRTKMGESVERRVRSLVETLSERFPAVPSADVKELLALVPTEQAAPKAKTKGGKTLEELLAQVYQQPDDDTVRQVYADALLEVGDPRGEFMVLQFKRARGEGLTPGEAKQEAALQKKHAKAWLGPLYDVLHTTHLEFRKGFLFAAQIRPVGKAILPARNHPAWSTVRELDMSTGGTNERGASLIVQPNARRIRVMTDVVHFVLDELVASPGEGRELEVLEVSWLPLGEGESGVVAERAWKALLTGQAFPKLHELRLGREAASELEALDALWSSPLGKRLTRVRLDADAYTAKKALAVAARQCTRQLSVELDFGPFVCAINAGGHLELRSDPSRLDTDSVWKQLVPALDPTLWKKVTVAPGTLNDAQQAALRKRIPRA